MTASLLWFSLIFLLPSCVARRREPIGVWTRLRMLALIAAWIAPTPASAQMTIDEIVITSGPAYSAGTFSDYFIAPVVTGTDLARVSVTVPSVPVTIELVEVEPGEFVCIEEVPFQPCEDFPSLAAVVALGDLVFGFEGALGEMDSVTIPVADYDPGPEPAGFPQVVSPVNGQTGLPVSTTVEWSVPPAWVQGIALGLEDQATGLLADETLLTGTPLGAPATDTTWSPLGLVDGTAYDFEISFLKILEIEDSRTTVGGRAFSYTAAFESFNEIVFTVPEPGLPASIAWAVAAVTVLARARARRSGVPGGSGDGEAQGTRPSAGRRALRGCRRHPRSPC